MKNISILVLVLFALLITSSCQKETHSASCSDGILNGTETGVDCGGDCEPCSILGCTDPTAHNYDPLANQDNQTCQTCTDGELNGDESEIDCGGQLCSPCLTETQKLQGIWRQLTHTNDGVDQRVLYDIDDVFYHLMETSNKIYQLNVLQNETNINLNTGSYDLDTQADELTRVMNNTTFSFRYSLLSNEELRLEAIVSGSVDIQTFSKISSDLCDGIVCPTNNCLYGYCP